MSPVMYKNSCHFIMLDILLSGPKKVVEDSGIFGSDINFGTQFMSVLVADMQKEICRRFCFIVMWHLQCFMVRTIIYVLVGVQMDI